MKNLLQKLKENTKLKNRVIALVSATLAFVLFVSTVIVYQKSKQDIKTEGNRNQNALEETLKNDSLNKTAEGESNFESAQNTDKDVTVPNSEKTSETSTQKNSTTSKTPNSTVKNNVNPSKPTPTNSTTELDYYTVKYCENGNHQWGSWVVEDGQNHYRTCKNCQAEDYNENWEWKPEYHMGNKSEYMELLALVNNARKDRGLKPFTYKSEWQAGADQRAIDLTQNFSHKRPDGRPLYTAYTDHGFDCFSAAECCAKGYGNAKAVFNGWKNSEKHWAALMNETPQDVVISRCDTYWVFSFPI